MIISLNKKMTIIFLKKMGSAILNYKVTLIKDCDLSKN